jgi:hypothetical protein
MIHKPIPPAVPYRAPDPVMVAQVRAAIERHKQDAYRRAVEAVRADRTISDLQILADHFKAA